MSDPASKRRKISSNVALFKPFKSPLKAQDAGTTNTHAEQNSLQLSKPNPGKGFASRLRQLKSVEQDHGQIDELSKLRREELSLLSQISKLKAELGQLKQAHSIEESDKEKELLDLTKVWRAASQQAAEEIYAVFRDKVNAVGGLKRWSELEKERKNNAFPLEETKKEVEDDTIDGEEGSDLTRSQEFVPEEEERQEDCKTTEPSNLSMDVMLHYLRIDPCTVGYDVQNQRWIT